MIIKELKEFFEVLDQNEKLGFSISEPFSWRGSYDEVAFSIDLNTPSLPAHNIDKIYKALKEPFFGWKGGSYSYDLDTTVNFEEKESHYSGGSYANLIMLNALKMIK